MATPGNNGPKSVFNTFNLVAGTIIVIGLIITVIRFYKGIGAVTNLDDNNPWGIWIGFDLLCGVALAAGGYTTSAACYIFGLKRYHSAVRPALLTAFLGYALVVVALLYDLGRPWRLPYPIFYQHGTTSLLFEVGLCVCIYLTVLFIEFTPALFEWLGMKKLRNFVVKGTLALTILGVVLSTLHQSSLGALYTIAPSKLHPLWYSPYMPLYFFVSSIVAGLSMVIFESSISHKKLHRMMDEEYLKHHDSVVLGFGKACSLILFGYFFIKTMGVAYGNNWHYLASGYGVVFLIEMLGFVALPCFLYAVGVRDKNIKLIQRAAVLTVIGIVFNRFNVSMIAFNYQLPSSERYFPTMMEIGISVFIVTVGVVLFRFITTRMPIFFEHPDYKGEH
ncbi:sulfate respiration complex protein HmcC [Maridesulfovibrio bastinii]|jgi:Ni/Fe-hydrogenase subunit HybB-like protein|uniref:sulfate respiration complex protein HmcC n=1 Tax=Maridesulfovibrio bastinii TaxID=47157 RepID=UPI0003FB918D|nr:Ni/Fe-hydrogenase cytochrome b subunit [Maridesulfovibrio bastinii]